MSASTHLLLGNCSCIFPLSNKSGPPGTLKISNSGQLWVLVWNSLYQKLRGKVPSPLTAKLWNNLPVTHQLMFGLISTANLCIFILQPQMFLLSVRLSNLLKSPAQFFTSLIAPLNPSKLKLTFQPTFYSSLPFCSLWLPFSVLFPSSLLLFILQEDP